MSEPLLPETAALQCGRLIARKLFEKRHGNSKAMRVEVHLREDDLAIVCASAFELGAEEALRALRGMPRRWPGAIPKEPR
jgi:hypothetical protein